MLIKNTSPNYVNDILITGATGMLGSAVIATLLKKLNPGHISIITRNEAKREAFEDRGFKAYLGSYDNKASLQQAMPEAGTVLLISSGDVGDRMEEHRNVIDAAVSAGVRNIAYTGRSLKDRATLANRLMEDHFETEDYIKKCGLEYTIFRNVLYMDVLPLFIGKQVFETGILLPAGDGKVAFALRNEMGEAMANVLLNETCENKTYTFTGSEAYSFYDVASVLSTLSEKKVNYTPLEDAAFEKMMLEKGMPRPMVKKIADFNTDIRNNQEAEITTDLAKKLGRKPSDLITGLKYLFSPELA